MGKRVLVTGGGGFLGSHVCDILVGRGDHVVCVDNFVTGVPVNVAHLIGEPNFVLRNADVCDPMEHDGPLDAVMHLASPASPVAYMQLPFETLAVGSTGTMNLLNLALAKDARFILASTSEVYGDPLVHPQPESYWGNVNPIGPRAVYDEAKRYAEALTMAFRTYKSLDTGIVRIFNSYGPRIKPDDGRIVPKFVSQALRGESITVQGDGSQTRSLCYVTDTAAGLVALLDSAEPGPINIGNPHEMSVLEIAEMISGMVGSQQPIVFSERPDHDIAIRRPDITLAQALLSWKPLVPVAEGLEWTIEWFRRHPDLARYHASRRRS